ncbi:jg19291 [Pararge aegeria aegeria]|uniref:Jg19291 protein n=1 Tax=Pararge aegeria aegeria TaxID=348720 RepID=A0A8S4RRZ5_9NEOP|nr:jg19291 [Pararge aegeria aegeria]
MVVISDPYGVKPRGVKLVAGWFIGTAQSAAPREAEPSLESYDSIEGDQIRNEEIRRRTRDTASHEAEVAMGRTYLGGSMDVGVLRSGMTTSHRETQRRSPPNELDR